MSEMISTATVTLVFQDGYVYIGGVDAHTWARSRFNLCPSSYFSFKNGMVALCGVTESIIVSRGIGHDGMEQEYGAFGNTAQMYHYTDILDCWVRWLTALCSAINVECRVEQIAYFKVVLRLTELEQPLPMYRDPFPAILRTPRKPLPAKFRNRHKRGQQG